jgi:serine/threonine-protein kinase RsbW
MAVTLTDADASLRRVQDEMLRAAEEAGYGEAGRFALRLALEEAVVNAFRHGNAGDYEAGVDVSYEVGSSSVRVVVEDRGRGFDPGVVPDPTAEDRLSVPSGRGLLLMRAYMSEVRHNERGNRVEMLYERDGGGGDGG